MVEICEQKGRWCCDDGDDGDDDVTMSNVDYGSNDNNFGDHDDLF